MHEVMGDNQLKAGQLATYLDAPKIVVDYMRNKSTLNGVVPTDVNWLDNGGKGKDNKKSKGNGKDGKNDHSKGKIRLEIVAIDADKAKN